MSKIKKIAISLLLIVLTVFSIILINTVKKQSVIAKNINNSYMKAYNFPTEMELSESDLGKANNGLGLYCIEESVRFVDGTYTRQIFDFYSNYEKRLYGYVMQKGNPNTSNRKWL